jgi:hypothetical protein
MSLFDTDPVKANALIDAVLERQKEQKKEQAERDKEAARDPIRAGGLAFHQEWKAAQTAARDRIETERLEAARAAGAAEAQAVAGTIRAELERLATPAADLERLTAEALDRWRVAQATAAANAPSLHEQLVNELRDSRRGAGQHFAEADRMRAEAARLRAMPAVPVETDS